MRNYRRLMNYRTGEYLRAATVSEHRASVEAAALDGGVGAILVDGVVCYVEFG